MHNIAECIEICKDFYRQLSKDKVSVKALIIRKLEEEIDESKLGETEKMLDFLISSLFFNEENINNLLCYSPQETIGIGDFVTCVNHGYIPIACGLGETIYYDTINGVFRYGEVFHGATEQMASTDAVGLLMNRIRISDEVCKEIIKEYLEMVLEHGGNKKPLKFVEIEEAINKIVRDNRTDKSKISKSDKGLVDTFGTWTVTLYGGKNGGSNWHDYFEDMANLLRKMEDKGIDAWTINLNNDCLDDAFRWTIGVREKN
jgi:hypothetical protein